ncbi:Response regulator of zinc sigma-54-dependent two-component system [hydrothermal vent metagenome]|uniref:Response regulator of zinc sigma-54-dependent two-component system n=1 Tax=hydrothermal vent metagenome TaxID=652676 RepID=A0A3B1DDS8_9ZZZZ
MKDYKDISLNICIVDDEEILRITTAEDLRDAGHNVVDFELPEEALKHIKQHPEVDLVISDIKMPQMNGVELLKKVKDFNPKICVILITAFGNVKSAVQAIKMGAFDYITKPFEPLELINLIDKVAQINCLKFRNKEYSNFFLDKYDIDSYWGSSERVKKIKEEIKLVANSNSTVLITGETGTGKELIANIIHYNSNRNNKPLVKVSCAILSKDIFESELFGHAKGAFTGADKERTGRFEEADGGTIYLDDIDDIPIELQVKLLRVLQENEIEKVGSSKTAKIDVRIIASTKADLSKLAEESKFRKDLYYRLNIFPIALPSLRERRNDIPQMFDSFLNDFPNGRKIKVDEEIYGLLKNYNWPGNTRELENLVERLLILAKNNHITADMIPAEFLNSDFNYKTNEKSGNLVAIVSNLEIQLIKNALAKSNGGKNKAAEILGIPVSTLRSKMDKYGML